MPLKMMWSQDIKDISVKLRVSVKNKKIIVTLKIFCLPPIEASFKIVY
jgi:hypothetical protein